MKRWQNTTGLLLVAVGCVVALLVSLPAVERANLAVTTQATPCVLIDPGHGGADGGATGVNGKQEKEINLRVGETLARIVRIMGVEVRMTRDSDVSIHSSDATTLREQKVSDMHNRLALYEQATLVVSIHQNHFSQSRYSGAQVFYGTKNEKSRALASAIREQVIGLLQPENERALKAADDSLFLPSNTTVPVALVECGFLSNAEECDLLSDSTYQRQMAFAVAAGIFSFEDWKIPL